MAVAGAGMRGRGDGPATRSVAAMPENAVQQSPHGCPGYSVAGSPFPASNPRSAEIGLTLQKSDGVSADACASIDDGVMTNAIVCNSSSTKIRKRRGARTMTAMICQGSDRAPYAPHNRLGDSEPLPRERGDRGAPDSLALRS